MDLVHGTLSINTIVSIVLTSFSIAIYIHLYLCTQLYNNSSEVEIAICAVDRH